MADIQTFKKERKLLQSSEKFPFKWDLRYPQFECIKKSVQVFQNSREYFLDCVPRFGKTSAGYYLSLNIIKSNIVVIFTGVTTRSEWEDEIRNFNISNLKFYSDNDALKSIDMNNLDPNYTYVFYCNLMLMERNGEVETKLLSGLSKYKVTYILDEVHHFVGSENVQKYISLIRQCSNHYLIPLTGTAYTDFCKSFKEENIYRCTYEDTWNYKRAGLIDYCLPKLHLTIPTELASILNKKKYDYLKLWRDNSKSKEAIKIILKSIKTINKKKEDLHNFLIVCNSQEECDELNNHFSKWNDCTSRVVYGGAKDSRGKEWDSDLVNKYLKDNPNTYNFLLTCSKFCTGSTIRELQGVLKLSYKDLLIYLKQKYGTAKENYFLTVRCDRKGNIGRGNEGLFCHHDYEYDPENPLVSDLSKPEIARQFTYKYQEAQNLTYCNWIEHLVLHCKINVLRQKQLNRFISDGVLNYFIPELNDFYRYRIKNPSAWKQIAFSLIEDNYDDYCKIIENWFSDLGMNYSNKWKELTTLK